MKTVPGILLGILLFSCNPYEQYKQTHYYIQAEVIPDSAWISANVQMVFVAAHEYKDSISFDLNPSVNINSLASQALENYLFGEYQAGKLVLYLEDVVYPGEELNISLNYSGGLFPGEITRLDSNLLWYPVNTDTHPCTWHIKMALPGYWLISYPETSRGKHGKWLLQSLEPKKSIDLTFSPAKTNN